jgi:pimeloyl-ACP methyl ester carboxylesterase
MRRAIWLVVLVSTLSLAAAVRDAGAAPAVAPAFHTFACPAGVFRPKLDVECGFVRVPEDRAHPNGRMITVPAAVIHASTAHPARDPIVFLDGGPSFGAISSFPPDFYFNHAGYSANRDVILVDTRGTGLSTPRLGCPEFDRAEVRAFYSKPSVNSQVLPIYRAAIRHCHDRFTARGIDLAAYNSAESAADLEALRLALGVHRWNMFGVSADGTLALTYMRLYPHALRSVVIDSGMSTQVLWGLDYDRGLAQELDAIFAGCRANAACNATYPGLRHAFFRKVAQLQQHPATITFPDFQPHPVQLRLDGAGMFADVIFSIFPGDAFSPEGIHDLLNRMWRETHGQLVGAYRDWFGTGPATNGHANDFVAQGKSMSYVCHDQVSFITHDDLVQAAHDVPAFAPRYLSPNYDLADGFNTTISPAGCRIWDVGQAAQVQDQPVESHIPTLVLAGEYDRGVPPYIVRQVMVGLSRGHYYEFPASAHIQLASYNNGAKCARRITTQFLDNPNVTPDSSCIAALPQFDFTP